MTVYHIDPILGTTAGDGSMADPNRTWDSIKSGIVAGDIIKLKKGCTFRESVTFPASISGTQLQRIKLTSYGSGDNPKINGSEPCH